MLEEQEEQTVDGYGTKRGTLAVERIGPSNNDKQFVVIDRENGAMLARGDRTKDRVDRGVEGKSVT